MRKKEIIDAENVDTKTDIDKVLDEFSELAENGGVTINGRIYRVLLSNDNVRQPTEFVAKVDHFVDEDFVGRNFGSGKYKIRYIIKADGKETVDKNVIFTVGKEYDKFVQKPSNNETPRGPEVAANTQTPRGGFLENLLNGLTPEKITAYSLAVKTLKEFFAPPPPPPSPDWAQIIALLTSKNNEPKQALSDTIVLSAMETLKQQNRQPSILEQMRELKKIKEELGTANNEESDDEEEGETMNVLLKTALEYLPQLLQKNNNNFQAVGVQAAENPLVKNLVANDPELAQTFFEKAREKYGLENAQKLALGFGINFRDAANVQEETAED